MSLAQRRPDAGALFSGLGKLLLKCVLAFSASAAIVALIVIAARA